MGGGHDDRVARTGSHGRARRRGHIGLAALALAFVLAASSCNAEWLNYGSDAGHSNATTDTGISESNLATLAPLWTADVGTFISAQPVEAAGVLYVETQSGSLLAYSADGTTDCSGSPDVCTPVWYTSSALGTLSNTPAIVDGQVLIDTEEGVIAAFDAAGKTDCTVESNGTLCQPLWTATNPQKQISSFQVSGGQIYATGVNGGLAVYDAAGVDGCGGTPKTCAPLWTGTDAVGQYSPAVANGDVYVVTKDLQLGVYSADGSSCPPPASCTPLWTGSLTGLPTGSPAVVGGDVYIDMEGELLAFDATGTQGCDTDTATCAPIWTGTTNGELYDPPSVADGRVYVGASNSLTTPGLEAFDAAGSAGCSGTPTTCTPLWTSDPDQGSATYSVVANGLVFASTAASLDAFDAAGSLGCSGSPTTCAPLWSTPGNFHRPIVARGTLYAENTTTDVLEAFRPTS